MPIHRGEELATLAVHSMETGTRRMIHHNVRNDGLIQPAPRGHRRIERYDAAHPGRFATFCRVD
ncbi:hypothetical protein [Nonomuraea sp. NPDC005501]|uniref:hypothetical protein n=1 Tax=Nonomuraea sp. NPDC005501 TaxID=3156884 RepID=UPI0033ACB6BB